MSEISRKVYGTQRWKKLRAQVLKEEAHTCHWCGGTANTVDHVVEIDRAPELAYDRGNLVAACRPCNSKRGSTYQSKVMAERRRRKGYGYSIPDPRACAQCGDMFTPDRRNLEAGHGKYCSKDCAAEAQRKPRWLYTARWNCTACGEEQTDGPHESIDEPNPRQRQTCGKPECQDLHNLWASHETYWRKTNQTQTHPDRRPTNWTVEKREPVFSSQKSAAPPPLSSISPQGAQHVDRSVDNQPDADGFGRIEPRLATPRLGDETFGPDVAAWAARNMPGELMPWQQLVLDGQLEHDGTGQLHRSESLVSVGRQNGKSYALGALVGWWATEMPRIAGRPQRIISTAHKLDRAFGLFKELAPILEARFDAKVNWSYGRNFVEFKDGTIWHVNAATPQNAHGATCDLVVIDEVWNIGPDVIFDAYRPTMTARPNPLMSMWSTAGDEGSKVMMQLREQAIQAIDSDRDSALYFAEWSPPPGSNLEDPNTWAWANPALGTTINADRLRRMAETPNRQAFYRAHCNVWISASASWLPAGHWDSCLTTDAMPAGGWLAVDSDVTDLRYTGVRVAPDDQGRLHVHTEFVVDNANAMWDEIHRVLEDEAVQLALTPGFYALCPPELLRRCKDFGQREMTTFTAIVRNMILERRIVHHGQLALAEQVNRAVAGRSSGTITLSSQKSPGPIEQTRCMVAAAGFAAQPQAKIRKPMLGVAK